jgi:hypothetical protein
MEELDKKIRTLSRNRIEYFLNNPRASKAQFLKDIKGQIAQLVQVCGFLQFCEMWEILLTVIFGNFTFITNLLKIKRCEF